MKPIETYVFIDLEMSGLPSEDNNRVKITEISLVAVKRAHVLDARPGAAPRVQHKLTLCINPLKFIHSEATDVTGLCNDLLEHEPSFNLQVFNLINIFLNVLAKPVCLIAQNGHNFDFPILKNHFEKLYSGISEDILCADSLHAFYDIEKEWNTLSNDSSKQESNNSDSKEEINEAVNMVKSKDLSQEEKDLTDFYKPNIHMQAVNECTPKNRKAMYKTLTEHKNKGTISRYRKVNIKNRPVRRKLFWGNDKKPSSSYKLKDVYARVLNRPPMEAHRAENDCLMALEIAMAFGESFVVWVDDNNCRFSDVKPMTIGVPLGE